MTRIRDIDSQSRVVFFKGGDVVAEVKGQGNSYDGLRGYLDEIMDVPEVDSRLVISSGRRRASVSVALDHFEVFEKPSGGVVAKTFRYIASWWFLFRQTASFRPDAVVALDNGYMGVPLYLASVMTRADFILAVPGQVIGPRFRDWVRCKVALWLTRRKRTVAVLARGEYLKGELLSMGVEPGKVRPFFPFYDEECVPERCSSSLNSPVSVVFVGRLSEVKGVDVLPVVARALAEKNAVIRVVGDGPLMSELATDMDAIPGAQWESLGAQSHQEVMETLACSDIVIAPSRFEGVAKSVMEAVISGAAVVAFDVGGISDWVSHRVNGVLVPAGDSEGFAMEVANLVDDRECRERMHQASIDRRQALLELSPGFGEAVTSILCLRETRIVGDAR